jgi:FdhE protein
MTWTHERRIARAGELMERYPESSELLSFYRQIAQFQSQIFTDLKNESQTDLRALLGYFPGLFELVGRAGPALLSDFARETLRSPVEREDLLRRSWETDEVNGSGAEPAKFFARVLLQPYAEYLASRGAPDTQTAGNTCPFCGARPVAGLLRGEGDGAKRSLLCSVCATEWEYRRIVCPGCGEENKDRLPVYVAEQLDYVRLEACDACKTFIKSVDLTKNGLAVPVVDELATAALTIWAGEHGYARLETNLLGM